MSSSGSGIRKSNIALGEFFDGENAPGPRAGTGAVARIENGLGCCIRCPDGREVHTGASGLRAVAQRRASPAGLAMKAARPGIGLASIEVGVEAMSDGRGWFLGRALSPGSCDLRGRFRASARNLSPEIREMVERVVAHSPVGADFERPVKTGIELDAI